MYEGLLEAYMLAHNEGNVFTEEIPEYLIESVNDLLETNLTLDK